MLNKKFVAIPMLLITALAITGFAYAHWTKTLTITGNVNTTNIEWIFWSPITCLDEPNTNDYAGDCEWHNWQGDKDIGGPTLLNLVDDHTLQVTLQNVYPYYFETITFHVKVTGGMPLEFIKIIVNGVEYTTNPGTIFLDLNGDGYNDIKLYFLDNLPKQFHPGDFFEVSIWILILQNDAIEGQTLTFTIQLVAENWSP
jgi:hypothetical protein